MTKITLNERQLACLASPARNEVLVQLRSLGEASAREVAKAVSKKPEAVHYHLKALVEVGLAIIAFKRPSPKKPEAVYRSVGDSLELPRLDAGPQVAALTRKAVKAGLSATARGYLKAAELAESDAAVRSHMHLLRMNLRLSSEDAKKFLGMIEAAQEFASAKRNESGARLVWSSAVYPPID